MELLIARLDQSLKLLDREATLAAQSGKILSNSQTSLLAEYIQLTTTEGIIPAIQYIVLDGLARSFELYQDDRERSKILSAMAEELESSSESEILVSIQIVQYTYPSIYHISRELIDLSQKRALEHLTKIPIAELSIPNNYTAQNVAKEVISRPSQVSILAPNQSSNGQISIRTQPRSDRAKGVNVKHENSLEAIKSSTAAAKESVFYIYIMNVIKWLMIIIGFTIKWSVMISLAVLAFMAAIIGGMLDS